MAADTDDNPTSTPEDLDVDALVVGAGFSGLYALHRLRELGVSVRAVEAGDGVGGTWYWNRYPGCRCDVPSIEYSYGFDPALEQEWTWSENMADQGEIERYLNHVADRFGLRPHIKLSTRVVAAAFDEDAGRWTVTTDLGDRYRVKWLVMAGGALSAPNFPDIAGLDTFVGTVVHTGLWPREGVDVDGIRVGVIGTGSSGIQVIPHLAMSAGQVFVFQRTPNYALQFELETLDPALVAYVKEHYRELRARQRTTKLGVSGFQLPAEVPGAMSLAVGAGALTDLDILLQPEFQEAAQAQFAEMVRNTVEDPATAESLIPTDYPIGCKRVAVDIGYFATFNRDNVALVDLKQGPITEITPTAVRTEQGDFEIDVLVLATGFDAITGPLTRIDVRGRDGQSLADVWSTGAHAYLGLMADGFPNLFMITGPGSPGVLSNMVVSIEQHVGLAADIIGYMHEHGTTTIEPTTDAQAAWVETVHEAADGTQWTVPNCQSWYLGVNIDGKAREFLPYVGGVNVFHETCDAIVRDGFTGFVFDRERDQVST